MKSVTTFLLLLVSATGWQCALGEWSSVVTYPEGYRDWTHVKSTLAGPQHANFAELGGFRHIYANDIAMKGYRKGKFEDGSIIVFDWLRTTEKDAVFMEGERRQVDVMEKDSARFSATGGWGFQRFAGSSKTQLAATPTPQQCFACHDKLKKHDLVLSSYRE